MRLDDDYEDNRGGLPIIYMTLGVSAFILVVLLLVISLNKDDSKNKNHTNYLTTVDAPQVTEEPVITNQSTLVASDLDIWDMYPVNKSDANEEIPSPTVTPTPTPEDEVTPTPDMDDGKHVKVEYADGSVEWIKIDDKIEKNKYDYTNLVDSGGQLKYAPDGRVTSFAGIDVSRYQKDIDFYRVKAHNIDFVMIRVGARGYKNGALTIDESFEANLNNAIEAGMDVGVYFYSQAVNEEEALEEAELVINALTEKKIKYPVAFDMEFVENDSSRIDTLTKEERTQVAAAFVNKIKEAGYRPMIYGDKDWLLKRVDIGKFDKSSVWLAQYDKEPDYPYTFDMWQYSTDGDLYGVDGRVNLDICFVDYAAQ